MSFRIKCEYCDRAPIFQNVKKELVCDLHNPRVTEATRKEQRDLHDTRVAEAEPATRSEAFEALVREARAAVDDMAFVLHVDTRVHD